MLSVDVVNVDFYSSAAASFTVIIGTYSDDTDSHPATPQSKMT